MSGVKLIRCYARVMCLVAFARGDTPRGQAPEADNAKSAFDVIYKDGYWRARAGTPASGAGSSVKASNTTCALLAHATRLVATRKGDGKPVRIMCAQLVDRSNADLNSR